MNESNIPEKVASRKENFFPDTSHRIKNNGNFIFPLYKSAFICYNLNCSGPVVQSVSTPACHAGGRRFESVPGRQKRSHPIGGGFFFICKGRTRKPALGNMPGACCNRRGFSAEKRVRSGSPKKTAILLDGGFSLLRKERTRKA